MNKKYAVVILVVIGVLGTMAFGPVLKPLMVEIIGDPNAAVLGSLQVTAGLNVGNDIRIATGPPYSRLGRVVPGSRIDLTSNLWKELGSWYKDDTGEAWGMYSQVDGEHLFYGGPSGSNPTSIGDPILSLDGINDEVDVIGDVTVDGDLDVSGSLGVGDVLVSDSFATGSMFASTIDVETSSRPFISFDDDLGTAETRLGKLVGGDRLDLASNIWNFGPSWNRDDESEEWALYVQTEGMHSFYGGDAGDNPVSVSNPVLRVFGITRRVKVDGNLEVEDDLYVSGTQTSVKDLNVDWDLDVQGDTTLYGGLDVGGMSVFSSASVSGSFKLPLTSGAPTAGHCDQSEEYGFIKYDPSSDILYICSDDGWKAH